MNSSNLLQPFVVHVLASAEQALKLAIEARTNSGLVFALDLTLPEDDEALSHYLATVFKFPYETRGLDAAIDLISDLDWLKSDGYAIVATGMADSMVGESFVSLLPNIINRWRRQTVPFVVALDGLNAAQKSALEAANQRMEHAGSLPWALPNTGPVAIVFHT